MKTCTKCSASKELSDFHIRKNGRPKSECKKCTGDRKKLWAKTNLKASADILNRYRRKYPTIVRASHLKHKYNITIAQFDNMLLSQGGVCKICKLLSPNMVVDHDHATQAVRGILCAHCNSMIGFAKDSVANLKSAIDYLEPIGSDKHLMNIIN